MGKHINAQNREKMKIKKEKQENTVIVNVAQHEVNQQVMKMAESYYKLQESKNDWDAKHWDIHKVRELYDLTSSAPI